MNCLKRLDVAGQMEALAKHDFNASAEDELSFKRGQVLKVSDSAVSCLKKYRYRFCNIYATSCAMLPE